MTNNQLCAKQNGGGNSNLTLLPLEYHVKVAVTVEEATKLMAVGYEYVSTMDNKQIFRKRKRLTKKIGVFIES